MCLHVVKSLVTEGVYYGPHIDIMSAYVSGFDFCVRDYCDNSLIIYEINSIILT